MRGTIGSAQAIDPMLEKPRGDLVELLFGMIDDESPQPRFHILEISLGLAACLQGVEVIIGRFGDRDLLHRDRVSPSMLRCRLNNPVSPDKLGRLGKSLHGAFQRDIEAFEELAALDEGGGIAEIDASGGHVLIAKIDCDSVGFSECGRVAIEALSPPFAGQVIDDDERGVLALLVSVVPIDGHRGGANFDGVWESLREGHSVASCPKTVPNFEELILMEVSIC